MDMGTRPHLVLAATSTLSQPGGADYTHDIMMSTPSFETIAIPNITVANLSGLHNDWHL